MPEPSAGIKDYYMFLLAQAHILNKFVDKFNKFDLFLTKNGFKQAEQQLKINNLNSIKEIVKNLDIKNLKEQQEETTEEPSSEPTEEPSPSNKKVDEFVKSRFYTDLGELTTTLNSFVENFIKMWEAGLETETQPAAIEYITKYTATDKTPDTLEAEPSIAIDIREFNQQMKILRQYYDFFMENAKPILKSLKADPELNPNVTAAQPAGQEQGGEQQGGQEQGGEQQGGQEQDSISSDLSDAQAVIAALEGIEETGEDGLQKIYDIYRGAATAAGRGDDVTTQIEKIQSYYNSEGKQTTSMGDSILMAVSRLSLGDEFRPAIMRALNKTLGLNPDAKPWLSAAIKEFHKTNFYEKIEDPKVKRGLTIIVNQLFNNQTISETQRKGSIKKISNRSRIEFRAVATAFKKLNDTDPNYFIATRQWLKKGKNSEIFGLTIRKILKRRSDWHSRLDQIKKLGNHDSQDNQEGSSVSIKPAAAPTASLQENLLTRLIKEELKVLNGKKMVCN
jgi:hypothetical protein